MLLRSNPCLPAARMLTTLYVEPGAKMPCVALDAREPESMSFSNCFCVTPPTQIDGS